MRHTARMYVPSPSKNSGDGAYILAVCTISLEKARSRCDIQRGCMSQIERKDGRWDGASPLYVRSHRKNKWEIGRTQNPDLGRITEVDGVEIEETTPLRGRARFNCWSILRAASPEVYLSTRRGAARFLEVSAVSQPARKSRHSFASVGRAASCSIIIFRSLDQIRRQEPASAPAPGGNKLRWLCFHFTFFPKLGSRLYHQRLQRLLPP